MAAEFITCTQEEGRKVGIWVKHRAFLILLVTTILSTLLLLGDQRNWTRSGTFYRLVVSNRASTQIVIQIAANILGLVYTSTICLLINYTTRIQFGKRPVSLDVIRLWSDLCAVRVDWALPPRLLAPLLVFVSLSALPAAIWAGALTPITTTDTTAGTIQIPSYAEKGLIKEFPSELQLSGPLLRNQKGVFTYSVGVRLEGSLLSSAVSATPVDGGLRQHEKLDNSRFTFVGRSYGVGASVGLVDDDMVNDDLTTGYRYNEVGYRSVVTCIYNASSDFVLNSLPSDMLYSASGNLPNSVNQPEYSVYIGHSMSTIVAIGVSKSRDPANPARILAIAAGDSYGSLNATQCSIDFIPTRFEVVVSLTGRNISVTPMSAANDIEPSGSLTHVTMRQFELIANDQTNIYNSLVGGSLNASIGDYKTSRTTNATAGPPPTEAEATLAGLTNAITAMVDDLLVGYGSAQLMIAQSSVSAPVVVDVNALRFGQGIYIWIIVVLNSLIVLIVAAEAARTTAWRDLRRSNYMDTRGLILGQVKWPSEAGGDVGDDLSDCGDEDRPRRQAEQSKWSQKLSDLAKMRLMVMHRTGVEE